MRETQVEHVNQYNLVEGYPLNTYATLKHPSVWCPKCGEAVEITATYIKAYKYRGDETWIEYTGHLWWKVKDTHRTPLLGAAVEYILKRCSCGYHWKEPTLDAK